MEGKQQLRVQRWLYGATAGGLGLMAGRESLEGAVLWVDSSGRILAGNEAAVTTYGYWPAELSRLTLNDLAVKMAGCTDTLHRRKDGSVFFAEVEELREPAEGEGIRLFRIHDVSAFRQASGVDAMLQAIEQRLPGSQSVSEALQEACRRLVYLFGFSLVWIRASSPDGRVIGAGLASLEEQGHADLSGAGGLRVEEHLKVPLMAGDAMVGALGVIQGRPVPVDAHATALLRRIADRLAQVLLHAAYH